MQLLQARSLLHKSVNRAHQISARRILGFSSQFTRNFHPSPIGASEPKDAPYPIQKDPSHPSLYYHLRTAPNALSSTRSSFALSFSEKQLNERYPNSRAIIGWLPAGSDAESDVGLEDFRQNDGFLDLLHETIQTTISEPGGDTVIEADATQRVEGWLHIHDMRNVPPLGRIGDPDDIIATVRVEDGKILANTYECMPAYRPCTGDGPLQLTEGVFKRLQKALEREMEKERRGEA